MRTESEIREELVSILQYRTKLTTSKQRIKQNKYNIMALNQKIRLLQWVLGEEN